MTAWLGPTEEPLARALELLKAMWPESHPEQQRLDDLASIQEEHPERFRAELLHALAFRLYQPNQDLEELREATGE